MWRESIVVLVLALSQGATCNHYTTLGVSPGATHQEIKAAYRKQALVHRKKAALLLTLVTPFARNS